MNTAALAQPVVMLPERLKGPRFHETGMALAFTMKSENWATQQRLQREYRPENAAELGTWYGSETHTDTNGRRWTSSLPIHVVNDFGDLVPVPA